MKTRRWNLTLGANTSRKGCVFRVWAPRCDKVEVRLLRSGKVYPMHRRERGYFESDLLKIKAGETYRYVLDGQKEKPDPASRSQPEGVHGPSEVIDPSAFKWTDSKWKGIHQKDLILYEAHIGTFTKEGTFEAAIKKIPYLKKLGINCFEIMPVAQFPGKRNWGYDGVDLFAVQNSYGGVAGLKKLVNACHRNGIAVCLDVVYNHLGPEGNYLHDYGPYFTGRYHTPWGDAVNYDDRGSFAVRNFVISNALYWIHEYHMDVLRLDAIHSIYDASSKHILAELKETVASQKRSLKRLPILIAESDLNDTKIIQKRSKNGYGIDAQWSDDFHHAAHRVMTGEKIGYYQDFSGVSDLAKALRDHFVYDGKYSPFRQRKHGNDASSFPGEKFVIHIQNHDQIGNRAYGDRISTQISFEAQKVAAALFLLAPQLPMLWMGQEYGETVPFQYFVDHRDEGLLHAIREGRKREFISFGWKDLADPKAEGTYLDSKLDWKKINQGKHKLQLRLYQDLIALRKKIKPLDGSQAKTQVYVNEDEKTLAFEYTASARRRIAVAVSFSKERLELKLPFSKKRFKEVLRTDTTTYGGRVPASGKSRIIQKEVSLSPETAMIGILTS